MWCPGLAAIVASLVTKRRFSEIDWRPGPLKYLLAGWLIPIAYASVTYSFAWITGIGSMPSPLFLKRAAMTLNLHDKAPTEIVLSAFAYISVMGLLNIGALGEEIGWRGFLVPELNRWLGFKRAAILSGAVWAVWHWPVVIWTNYNAGTPLPYALACLSALAIASAVLLAWLRLKSGSIWPCYLLHAAHNAIIQMFFDRVTIDTGRTKYFTTEFGIGLLIPVLAIAWYCWRHFASDGARSMSDTRDLSCPSVA
jgi:membrane protease YdiL (CAAX protease family)